MHHGIPAKLFMALSLFAFLTASPLLAKGKPAAKPQAKASKTASKSLYDQLGGKKAIAKVVDNFVGRCARDERIKKFFAATAANPKRLAHFKQSLNDQLCQVTGGPCKYKGRDMASAHRGMNIGEADFDALVEDLGASLTAMKVSKENQGQIVALLAPLKGQIVSAEPIADTVPSAQDLAPMPRDTASDSKTPDSPPAPEDR